MMIGDDLGRFREGRITIMDVYVYVSDDDDDDDNRLIEEYQNKWIKGK